KFRVSSLTCIGSSPTCYVKSHSNHEATRQDASAPRFGCGLSGEKTKTFRFGALKQRAGLLQFSCRLIRLQPRHLRPQTPIIKNFDALSNAVVDPVSIEAVLSEQQLGVAVRNQTIRNSHSNHPNLVLQAILFEEFQHRRAKPTGKIRLFNGNDQAL